MRLITAVAVLLSAAGLGLSVAHAQDAFPMKLTELSVTQTIVDLIEIKAEKAAREQQNIDARRDGVVRRIMSSVCVGCLPSREIRPAWQARYATAKPRVLVRLVGLDAPAPQLER